MQRLGSLDRPLTPSEAVSEINQAIGTTVPGVGGQVLALLEGLGLVVWVESKWRVVVGGERAEVSTPRAVAWARV